MSVSDHISQARQVSEARTRSYVLPGALAALLFAAIQVIQFTQILGAAGFIAQLPLGIAFYYCWAWHRKLAEKADTLEKQAR